MTANEGISIESDSSAVPAASMDSVGSDAAGASGFTEAGKPAQQSRSKSEFSRAFAEDGARKTHIGGQALLEGIMMRGKYNWAAAVRTPEGDIYVEEHDLASGKQKHEWMRWPLVRGCTALVESLSLGFKALEIAAEHAFADDEESASKGADQHESVMEELAESPQADAFELTMDDAALEPKNEPVEAESAVPAKNANAGVLPKEPKEKRDATMTISMILGVVLGVALFIVVPAAVTNLIVGEYDSNPVLWNILDGILRVAVFVGYIWLVGRMEDMRRMFMYHGAEHKTIHCYEHGLDMTPENAREFPRLHVRCGTAFLIMVLIIAIIVYTVIPLNALIGALGVPDGFPKLVLVIAVRIIFLPVIAGISYEITVKWAGTRPDNPLVKVILWPGMQMQRLTTNEPEDDQLECAIAAMQRIIEREEAEKEKMQQEEGQAHPAGQTAP